MKKCERATSGEAHKAVNATLAYCSLKIYMAFNQSHLSGS